ncbi:hypothetical protein NDI48_31650 [Microcoleus sp. AS-A8]
MKKPDFSTPASFRFNCAYLRGKRDRFTDTEFFDACSRLSTMVGTRNITVLLAKLYAEQLIAAKEGTLLYQFPKYLLQIKPLK